MNFDPFVVMVIVVVGVAILSLIMGQLSFSSHDKWEKLLMQDRDEENAEIEEYKRRMYTLGSSSTSKSVSSSASASASASSSAFSDLFEAPAVKSQRERNRCQYCGIKHHGADFCPQCGAPI